MILTGATTLISHPVLCSLMAGKKKKRKEPSLPARDIAATMFSQALINGDDCILTFETGEEGERVLHILTGQLITPCMLGTLSNRCGLPEQQRSRHIILKPA